MLKRFWTRSAVFGLIAMIYVGAIALTLMYQGGPRDSVPELAASVRQSVPVEEELGTDSIVVEESVEVSVSKVKAEDVWFRLSEKMAAASIKRFEETHFEIERIAAFLKKLESIGSLEKFADEVTKFDNVWSISTDPEAGKTCIRREFRNHVLDSRAMTMVLDDILAKFESRLTEIDNALLVDCGIDADYQPPGILEVDFSKLHHTMDQRVGNLLPHAQGVWGECVVSSGVGIVVGALAEHLASKSESATDKALSLITGAGVGWAAEEIVASTGTARKNLIKSASSIRSQVLADLKAEPVQGNFWTEHLIEIATRHQVVCNLTIAESLGLDQSWAKENMPVLSSSK